MALSQSHHNALKPAMTQLRTVADGLRGRLPRTAELLEDAAEDVLQMLKISYQPSPKHRFIGFYSRNKWDEKKIGKDFSLPKGGKSGSTYGRITSVQPPRIARFGLSFEF